jgi:SAM-dependent methyltransferase
MFSHRELRILPSFPEILDGNTSDLMTAAELDEVFARRQKARIALCPRSEIGHSVLVTLNPPGQYADDRNLRNRQRFWQHQHPFFDTVGWVLDLAGLSPGLRVLDAGCGNGAYLRGLRDRQVRAAGCDLSAGMLRAVSHPALLNADVAALPVRDGAVDIVLAIHMLYHVPDRETAIRELRRVLAAGGTCIAVTNGSQHTRSLRALAERAVREETPGWQMRPATHAFSAENAPAQLGAAFESVTCVRPAINVPVIIRDATVAADYMASLASHHQDETTRPWDDVVEDVRQQVQAVIDDKGAFTTSGDLAAFICR